MIHFFTATTSSSITLSLAGIGFIALPISTATACGLSIGNKVFYEIFINNYIKHTKQCEKNQQLIYSKKLNMKVFVIILLKFRKKTKIESFL